MASSTRKKVKNKRKWPQAAPKEVHIGHQEKFLYGKSCQAFEWAAQGGGAAVTPGDVQEMTGHSTWCYGLIDK